MRPPVRGSRPQQPRGAADPSATRPAFMNNSGSEPNSPGVRGDPSAWSWATSAASFQKKLRSLTRPLVRDGLVDTRIQGRALRTILFQKSMFRLGVPVRLSTEKLKAYEGILSKVL